MLRKCLQLGYIFIINLVLELTSSFLEALIDSNNFYFQYNLNLLMYVLSKQDNIRPFDIANASYVPFFK